MLLYVLMACFEKTPAPINDATGIKPSTETQTSTAPIEGPTVSIIDGVVMGVSWDDGDTFKGIHPTTGKTIKPASMDTIPRILRSCPSMEVDSRRTLRAIKKPVDSQQRANGFVQIQVKRWIWRAVDCPDLREAIITAGLAHPFLCKVQLQKQM